MPLCLFAFQGEPMAAASTTSETIPATSTPSSAQALAAASAPSSAKPLTATPIPFSSPAQPLTASAASVLRWFLPNNLHPWIPML